MPDVAYPVLVYKSVPLFPSHNNAALKVSDCSLFSILHRGHYWFLLVEHETAKRREKQAGGRGHLSLLPEHLSIRHQTVHGRQSIPDLQSGRWQRELPGISHANG